MRRSRDRSERGLGHVSVGVVQPRDFDQDARRWPRPGPAPEAPTTTGVNVAEESPPLGLGVEVGVVGGGEAVAEEGVHRTLLFVALGVH
jgi:hypothetical protein